MSPVIVDIEGSKPALFPAGTSREQIHSVLRRRFQNKQPQQEDYQPEYMADDIEPLPPSEPVDREKATLAASTIAQERRGRRASMSAEMSRLREADEGGFASGVWRHAEQFTRALSSWQNPIKAVETGVESAAVLTGLADPGSKLLVSPAHELGRAAERLGALASGVVEDTAALFSGEPETYGGNLLAAATGQPRPLQEAIKDVDGFPKLLADVSTAISHVSPQIIAQRGLVARGMAEAPAAGLAFSVTPEGMDARTGLTMMAFPGVSAIGRDLAIKAVGQRIGNETAANVVGFLGSYAAAQTFLDLSAVPDYVTMTPEQAKEAWISNFSVNLAFHLGHIPGMTSQALARITSSREFNEALSRQALETAAVGGLPSAAQRTIVERASVVGPATAAAAARVPPLTTQPVEAIPAKAAPIDQLPEQAIIDLARDAGIKLSGSEVTQKDLAVEHLRKSVVSRLQELSDKQLLDRSVVQQPETPAQGVAQAQAEITHVAKTEGKRSAKEVKAELIAKLEEAQAAAPSQSEIGPTTPIGRYMPVKIHIPGDGDFVVPNSKEAIGEVLKSAKRLQTSANAPIGTAGPREPMDRQSVMKRDIADAISLYGNAPEARRRLQAQLDQELDLEPAQRERLQRVVDQLQYEGRKETEPVEAMRVEEPTEEAPAPSGLTMPLSLTAQPGTLAQPVKASTIIRDMADLIDRPIRIGHIGGSQSIRGIFKPGAEVARLRKANDLPVAAHEIAHALERIHRRAMGIGGKDIGRRAWQRALPANVRAEFQALDYDPAQQRPFEGFAEFVRHWLTIGDTHTIAPNSHAWFEQVFLQHNPELAKQIGAVREKITAFRNQGAVKRVESLVQFKPESQPLAETLRRKGRDIERLWIDDLADLERMEREIGGGNLALGDASPTKIARMVTQASGTRARSWARHGQTDFAGNRTGPSLKAIFGRKGVAGDERQAILYAVARRAVELHNRGIDPGITKDDAQHTVKTLQTAPRLRFANEIHDWNRGALEYLRDAGGISQETFDAIGALNQSYIPFFRVFEQEGGFATGGRRIGDTPQAVKRIKGSGRDLINPIESMQQHANQIIATADKVRVARALVELSKSKDGLGKYVEQIPADRVPTQFTLEDIARQVKTAGGDLSAADLDAVMTIFANSPRTPTGGNIVSFVRDGKRQFYELDPELFRAIQALDYQRIHPVLDAVFGIPARITRMGATGLQAGFQLITNPMRDYASMILQTKGNPVDATVGFFKQLAKQIGLGENEVKNIWRATGGELSQPLGMDRASLRRAVDDVLDNTVSQKILRVVKHPIEFIREVLSFTEVAPRVAEFELTLREMGWKKGQTVSTSMAIEAANRAAEITINFRRAGHYGRYANQVIAFFNPSVQGLSKFNRAHSEQKLRSVVQGIGLVTAPALLNWWVNRDDEEWRNFPAWVKYGFYNVKIGGEWVRIPTPFEWWYVYGALPMASADALYREKPEEMTKLFKQSMEQLTPPIVPSLFIPTTEAIANKSFYTGRPIVPKSMERLLPQEQAKTHTSATARQVADILSVGGVAVSPAKIEHVLNGQSGGFWGDMISTIEQAAGTAPPTSMLEPADIPIAGRLFIRDGSSAVIDEFYTELEYLQSKEASRKKLIKDGNTDRAAKYEMSDSELARLGAMKRRVEPLSKLREQYRDSTTREERNELWKRMTDLAKTALDVE